MSESDTESGSETGAEPGSISDEELPEDLQPGEDNPLAAPPGDDQEELDRDELDVLEGKTPVESSDDSGDDGDSGNHERD